MTPPGKERTTVTALKPLGRPAAESENSVSIVMTASELAMSICVQWLALYGFFDNPTSCRETRVARSTSRGRTRFVPFQFTEKL